MESGTVWMQLLARGDGPADAFDAVRADTIGSGFADAVDEAIASGAEELSRLDTIVADAEFRIRAVSHELSSYPRAESKEADGFFVLLEAVVGDLKERLAASRRVSSTFNIAFFGRTGAGKSTLLSALGQLNGELVSDGRSDFTTDVHPLDWHGCRLYDTPGINGWGRTRPRPELEEAARQAVEVADVVLLCFDSQSQQASEFAKVAAWVQAYRKPVLAVLNVRNPLWRHPARISAVAQRQGLARTAQQHADNISGELEAIGLHDVPIVAIHSKRGLFARASTPWVGPAAAELEAERAAYGFAYLDRMSNLPVLEELISGCIVGGAGDLRLAALREGIQAGLRQWATEIDAVADRQLNRGKALEALIGDTLNILGYPDPERRKSYLPDPDSPDFLAKLETARGEPFAAPATGRLERHAKHLLRSNLKRQRARSLKYAQDMIIEAFDTHTQIPDGDFEWRVFDAPKIAAAISKVADQASIFFKDNLDLASLDTRIDLDLINRSAPTVRANAGLGQRRAANVLKATGVLSSSASAVLGAVAVTNFWNPAGWTAAAILGGLGIISAVASFFGRRNRKRAEEKRITARAQAIADARASVNSYFDECENETLSRIIKDAWANASEPGAVVLAEALRIRTGCTLLLTEAAWLREQADAQRPVPAPAEVIQRAVQRAQDLAPWDPPTASALLLGEDWVLDTSHVNTASRMSGADRQVLLAASEQDRLAFSSFLEAVSRSEGVAEASRWFEHGSTSDDLDEVGKADFAAARTLIGVPPKVVVLGDYSSGKTSLIKRLLAESGTEVPSSLRVAAGPATSASSHHRFGRLDLVDAPGFQSGNDKHDAAAFEASLDAALVIVVLHVNLLIGDTGRLERLLKGDESLAGHSSHTVFVIGRIDEVGSDPEISARDFLGRRRRKIDELLNILDSRDLGIERRQILALSADPFGLVGDRVPVTMDDYAQDTRSWDGVRSLTEPLLALDGAALVALAKVAALHRGHSALLGAIERLRSEVDDLEKARAGADRFQRLWETALAELRLLTQSVEGRTRRVVDDHANEILGEALGSPPDEVDALSKRLQSWWQDPRLDGAMAALEPHINRDLEDWSKVHASEFERELRRFEFALRAEGVDPNVDVGNGGLGDGAKLAGHLFKDVTGMVKVVGNRDAVYGIGKAMGVKFKPWGAVKMGVKVAKVGAVLGVVAAGFDIAAWVSEAKAEDGRERARRAAVKYVRETKEIVVSDLLAQPDGPMAYLRLLDGDVVDHLTQLRAVSVRQRTEATDAEQRLGRLLELQEQVDDFLAMPT